MPAQTQPKSQPSVLDDLMVLLRQIPIAGYILIILFAWLYYEPLMVVWRAWTKDGGYYSHGPLVPFVAAWMLYTQKEVLLTIPHRSSWPGLAILLICSLIYLVSSLCHMYPPKYVAFVFYLLGFNLLLFGTRMARATLLPWAFLFFMVPLPDGLIDLITYKLRIAVTATAVSMTEPFNWYVVKSGNYIFFPNGDTLVVGDICAGLRSIISLLALGAVFAFLSRLSPFGSTLLFILSAPVAIITNILRIFALIVIAHFWGSEVASGRVHDISGWAIFVVAFSLLYLCYFLLEKILSKQEPAQPAIPEAQP